MTGKRHCKHSWEERVARKSGSGDNGQLIRQLRLGIVQQKIFLGVDAGGTFTDFICLRAGPPLQLQTYKTLSTPSAPEQAILRGLQALGLDDPALGDRLHIIHGSTVATNAALEGKMASTAFITNKGFGDLLTLARQTRPALYQLEFAAVEPPVPSSHCLEIDTRLDAGGNLIKDLNEDDLDALLEQLSALDVDAVAINLLFSFLDDRQERTIAERIQQAGLDVFISRSSHVLPVYKEYERGIATWLNAALGPVINGYLGRLQKGIGDASLQIMQSNGETVAAEKAAELAVNLLLSGPAGGLMAMQFLGKHTGNNRFISFDMGGTSTDVALLSGRVAITTESSIDRFPVAVPMVDMHTIGAGGGSIAYVDEGGMLQVGPRSAGADPGPACYDQGGTEATVTDANLVLGRLLGSARLAGSVALRLDLARNAIAKLAEQIGLGIEETALGIVSIANEHMAKAIRMISVNRGHDPALFQLASFGGAGGLHVCAIAEAMQMNNALVPVYGGVLSALGMLVAEQGQHLTRTVNVVADPEQEQALIARFEELEQEGFQALAAQGAPAQECQAHWLAELRYQGQAYTLSVVFESLAAALQQFAELHEQRYGYRLNSPVEVVNLRVNVNWPQEGFTLPDLPLSGESCNKAPAVKVYGEDDPVPVWRRDAMPENESRPGPAIIIDDSATTWIASGWNVRRDRIGNLHITKSV